jgi:hypothetical protein
MELVSRHSGNWWEMTRNVNAGVNRLTGKWEICIAAQFSAHQPAIEVAEVARAVVSDGNSRRQR